jgi:hypothetical protein
MFHYDMAMKVNQLDDPSQSRGHQIHHRGTCQNRVGH